MNTLMAGVQNTGRGRYTAAGYAFDDAAQENELYIGQDQAGFARELMRDSSRIGYSAQELDDDGLPFSFFIEEAERDARRVQERKERIQATRKKREAEEALSFTERLMRAWHRERRAAAICGFLLALNLTLLAFFGQAAIDGVRKRDQILSYERGAAAYQAEIDAAKIRIAQAQNGELIRNKAQNELGMLRGERMATQKIYIQTSNLVASEEPAQQPTQEKRGLLDWLLSVADVFDFKS